MKTLLSALFCVLCALTFAQPLNFPDCDSPSCRKVKYEQLMQAVEQAIYEYYNFQYNDSISLTLRAKKGELILEKAYAWVNEDAPQYYFEVLKDTFSGFSSSADSLVTINWVQSLKLNHGDYPDINCATQLPTPAPCEDFNKQGQQACWRYSIFARSTEFSEKKNFNDFMGADLFYEDGRLNTVNFFDPPLNQKMAIPFLKAIASIDTQMYTPEKLKKADRKYRYRMDPYPHGNRDSASRVEFLSKHLDFYVDNQLWQQFFDLLEAHHYYPEIDTSSKREAMDIYNYLEKGYETGKFKNKWWKVVDKSPISNKDAANYREVVKVPVFDDCDSDDSNEELRNCFERSVIKHVAKTFKYPEKARQEGKSGRMYISFVVEKSGEICEIEIIKSAHPLLDIESLRVVSEIPPCEEPAIVGNKPVRMSFTLPINAKLQ